MKIWGVLKGLSMRELLQLSLLMLRTPFFIIPTLKATRETMVICDSLYKEEHHQNGKANAFRHALWNILICRKTYRITKNEKKSVIWAQKVTDLHEKLAPNEPLAKAMDLHNNKIGRKRFSLLIDSDIEEVIDFLKESVQNAKRIVAINEIRDYNNDLVYL